MLRICSEEGGRGLDKCSKLAQKREGGVKKRPENAHMINERSLTKLFLEECFTIGGLFDAASENELEILVKFDKT